MKKLIKKKQSKLLLEMVVQGNCEKARMLLKFNESTVANFNIFEVIEVINELQYEMGMQETYITMEMVKENMNDRHSDFMTTVYRTKGITYLADWYYVHNYDTYHDVSIIQVLEDFEEVLENVLDGF